MFQHHEITRGESVAHLKRSECGAAAEGSEGAGESVAGGDGVGDGDCKEAREVVQKTSCSRSGTRE